VAVGFDFGDREQPVAPQAAQERRFRNHSKLMVVYGERFDCVIESSANVDTNPRTEQTCVTVDSGLCDFYKGYFDGINDFDGGYREWTPWERASRTASAKG
jgi:hypothetical protein